MHWKNFSRNVIVSVKLGVATYSYMHVLSWTVIEDISFKFSRIVFEDATWLAIYEGVGH